MLSGNFCLKNVKFVMFCIVNKFVKFDIWIFFCFFGKFFRLSWMFLDLNDWEFEKFFGVDGYKFNILMM